MRSLIALSILLALAGSSLAQDFVAPRQPRRTIVQPERAVTPLDSDSNVEGIVAAAFQTRQPWQLINPLAAKGYGDGRYLTSWSEEAPAKAKGFILFGIRFW